MAAKLLPGHGKNAAAEPANPSAVDWSGVSAAPPLLRRPREPGHADRRNSSDHADVSHSSAVAGGRLFGLSLPSSRPYRAHQRMAGIRAASAGNGRNGDSRDGRVVSRDQCGGNPTDDRLFSPASSDRPWGT